MFSLSVQVNDIQVVDASVIICYGEQRAPHEFKVSAAEVTYPVQEVIEEVVITEPDPGEITVVTAPPATSPQTSDVVSLAILSIGLSAVIAIGIKRKK